MSFLIVVETDDPHELARWLRQAGDTVEANAPMVAGFKAFGLSSTGPLKVQGSVRRVVPREPVAAKAVIE